jgi:hypothetical protein
MKPINMAEWLPRRISNVRYDFSAAWVQPCLRQVVVSMSKEVHLLLKNGWLLERIRECFNKLIAANTIELNSYKLYFTKYRIIIHIRYSFDKQIGKHILFTKCL